MGGNIPGGGFPGGNFPRTIHDKAKVYAVFFQSH